MTLYLSGFIALNTLFTSPVFIASSAKEFSLGILDLEFSLGNSSFRNSKISREFNIRILDLGILEFLKRHPLTPRKSRIPREFNIRILYYGILDFSSINLLIKSLG